MRNQFLDLNLVVFELRSHLCSELGIMLSWFWACFGSFLFLITKIGCNHGHGMHFSKIVQFSSELGIILSCFWACFGLFYVFAILLLVDSFQEAAGASATASGATAIEVCCVLVPFPFPSCLIHHMHCVLP